MRGYKLCTVPEAARLYGISQQAIHKRIKAGTMQGGKYGGRWKVLVPSESSQTDTSMTKDPVARDLRDKVDRLEAENIERLDRIEQLEKELSEMREMMSDQRKIEPEIDWYKVEFGCEKQDETDTDTPGETQPNLNQKSSVPLNKSINTNLTSALNGDKSFNKTGIPIDIVTKNGFSSIDSDKDTGYGKKVDGTPNFSGSTVDTELREINHQPSSEISDEAKEFGNVNQQSLPDDFAPLTKSPKAKKKIASPKQQGQRDLWDAFVTQLRRAPETNSERGKWNKGISELDDAGVTPDELFMLIRVYGQLFEREYIGPMAIAANLSHLRAAVRDPDEYGVHATRYVTGEEQEDYYRKYGTWPELQFGVDKKWPSPIDNRPHSRDITSEKGLSPNRKFDNYEEYKAEWDHWVLTNWFYKFNRFRYLHPVGLTALGYCPRQDSNKSSLVDRVLYELWQKYGNIDGYWAIQEQVRRWDPDRFAEWDQTFRQEVKTLGHPIIGISPGDDDAFAEWERDRDAQQALWRDREL